MSSRSLPNPPKSNFPSIKEGDRIAVVLQTSPLTAFSSKPGSATAEHTVVGITAEVITLEGERNPRLEAEKGSGGDLSYVFKSDGYAFVVTKITLV